MMKKTKWKHTILNRLTYKDYKMNKERIEIYKADFPQITKFAILRNLDCDYLDELPTATTIHDLIKLPGVGKIGLNKLIQVMELHGLPRIPRK